MTCLHVTHVMHMTCDMHIHDMPEHVPDRLKCKLTSMRNPIDMHLTPQLSGGIILRSALCHMSAYMVIRQLFYLQYHSMKAKQLIECCERIHRFQYLCLSLDGHASSSAVELTVHRRRRPASPRSVGGLHCC